MANFPKTHKEWDKPIAELEESVNRYRQVVLREKDAGRRAESERKLAEFEERHHAYARLLYSNLGPWEKVLVARAEKRPYTLDYVTALTTEFVELEGDRLGQTDGAIVGGPAFFEGRPVMVVGHQKGRTIAERQQRNFGYARPEGYRKAIRLFEMAERFRMPVLTFVDTPGADAGLEAESRGISEAIAASILKMFELTVPVVSTIIGEGGSGGAIGIACANRVLMLEHSIYSVIAPEGCASILWRAPERGAEAAQALKLTAQAALDFGIADGIVPEPLGGAHRDPLMVYAGLRSAIGEALSDMDGLAPKLVREARRTKFRHLGILATP